MCGPSWPLQKSTFTWVVIEDSILAMDHFLSRQRVIVNGCPLCLIDVNFVTDIPNCFAVTGEDGVVGYLVCGLSVLVIHQ